MIFRDDATWMSKEYFVKHNSDAPEALDQYLADTRDIGPPEILRSDDAPELKGRRFTEICRNHHIKREFTSARTPQLNGVAERGLRLIEKVARASAFLPKVSFVGMQSPATETLWAEAQNYSCDVLNRTATTSNRDKKSAYEMWHGVKPPPTLIQRLRPCFYQTKRKLKTDAQSKPGFYVGPALDHPRDTHRILY